MEFIETPVFTINMASLLTEAEYTSLQALLVMNPAAERLIPGTGGLRKLRIGCHGKGKRGGGRVIYYWQAASSSIYLLDIYVKSSQSDLTEGQKSQLASLIKELKK